MLTVKTNQLTADGCQSILVDDAIYCCPPPLCGNDLCCTFVAFFSLLPSGPIWDYWKQAAIAYFQRSDDPTECPLLQNPACPSLVLHTIYTVLKLKGLIHNALWPAFRESNPNTAVTTLDNHLARLKWEDCYAQHCRVSLGDELTPLEIWSDCGPVFCPPGYPPELENAVKRGVAVALTRFNMGVIKNLCGINWIIDPLGAELVPLITPPPPPCIDPPDEFDPPADCVDPPEAGCVDCADVIPCSNTAFEVRNSRDWLAGVGSGDVCDIQPVPKVPAYWDYGCDRPAGLPEKVWPGVMAAHCIVRSILPPLCPSNIRISC